MPAALNLGRWMPRVHLSSNYGGRWVEFSVPSRRLEHAVLWLPRGPTTSAYLAAIWRQSRDVDGVACLNPSRTDFPAARGIRLMRTPSDAGSRARRLISSACVCRGRGVLNLRQRLAGIRWLSEVTTGSPLMLPSKLPIMSGLLVLFWLGELPQPAFAEIPRPDDGPPALSPNESARQFHVPAGFRLELVAAEPLIREPSGVCWDESGRLFVCELHGYNLEGQYDIEELNETGQLDRVVRRIQANDRAKQAAQAETFGTIKLLVDSDGDSRMDQAFVWADRLPTCHGICPAAGGLIVACQAAIMYLADRDGDNVAEVRETLFEGFETGPLERSVNCPQWGLDGWIYVGKGAGGGTIRGPYLKQPVELPGTDFRLRADGSAIEPVVGATETMGFAWTGSGDRFVISTRTPGMFVAPLPWDYLARNPNLETPPLAESATSDERVYPTSKPHPWRTRRFDDPGFSKYYSDHYGIQESAANGYFTSACSPLVYQDTALPRLAGQLFACEPAQNLVHRALIERHGSRLALGRAPGEEQAEFLTSSDPWFHPIALAHAPDGSLAIVDFYREIIEDYSAIPRYLQQEYGLVNGQNHGRIWRLVHEAMSPPADPNMSGLADDELVAEIASERFWRRETARRMLWERNARDSANALSRLALSATDPGTVHSALGALKGLNAVPPETVTAILAHPAATVRRAALRLGEPLLDVDADLLQRVLLLVDDPEPLVHLQLALTLGASHNKQVLATLADLARKHGDEPWLDVAILTSVPDRGGALLGELLRDPGSLGHAATLLEPLTMTIAARHEPREVSQALALCCQADDRDAQAAGLRGLAGGLRMGEDVEVADTVRQRLLTIASRSDHPSHASARTLVDRLRLEDSASRQARLARATRDLADSQQITTRRLEALAELAEEDDPAVTDVLLAAFVDGTPQLRQAILNAIFSRRERLPALVDAVAEGTLPASALSAVEREALLANLDDSVRERAETILGRDRAIDADLLAGYVAALAGKRDPLRGAKLFQQKCGTCHAAHGLGTPVGPDLSAEFQRADETIVQDVLAPSAVISAGYTSYVLATTDGRIVTGLLAAESPTSITLKQAEGKQEAVLRKDIEELRASPVSIMPEDLPQTLPPADLADILAWLKQPSTLAVLVDENASLAELLHEGDGTAQFVETDSYSGRLALEVTPLQRHSSRLPGWNFLIREHPQPGEYRYMRFAWRSAGAHGTMLELAADGNWPAASDAIRRYLAGRNTTGWQAVEVSAEPPLQWQAVTRDLWHDFGDFTLTGIAPTSMGGAALFDRIELLREMPSESPAELRE